jgi:radical SAM superfamily enzyme YgiQ (UPF0313 family)
MKVCIIDVYDDVDFRISKDQNGQYGTANDYGSGLFATVLKKFVKNNINIPPLYVAQVIGELRKNNHEVLYKNSYDGNDEFDFYVVVSSIVCHELEIQTIKNLKKKNLKVFSIGPFASNIPTPYIEAGSKVITGEPEMFFFDFDGLNNFYNYQDIIKSQTKDINQLSYPGWDIIFKNNVPKFSFLGKGPTITINASRGCPYACFNYCVYPLTQGRKLRLKDPEALIKEMIYFEETLSVKNFIFRDPVFSINKKHTLEICDKLIEANRNFNICIETHLKNIDEELAYIFKKSGVKLIYVGIESEDKEVLEDAKRTSDTNSNQISKINLLENLGIKVKAMYILGLPKDTKETFQKTIKYASKLCSSYAQFSVFTPYPGTPIFDTYKNKITSKKFSDFNQWQLVFDHPNFTKKNIRDLLSMAYRKYYTNPFWIIKYLFRKLK